MRVLVDVGLCVGHARCEAVASALYRTDPESGHVLPVEGEIPLGLEPQALRGARACPERAIRVVERSGTEENALWPPE